MAVKDADISEWQVTLLGPENSPYRNGLFKLSVNFCDSYPFKPMKVRFDTRIYHINVAKSGAISLDVLKDHWSPALTMKKICLKILDLMKYPEEENICCSCCSTPEFVEVYKQSKEKYAMNAREWTRKYAY